MKFPKMMFVSLAAILSLSLLLTACGGSKEGAAGSDEKNPLKVSVMTILNNADPASDDNAIKRAIEEATNSKLTIQWVSSNTYKEKLNVTLASGDIPDLIYIDDPFSSVFRSMVQQGAFWDVTDYVKDYPNLTSGISETAWELTKMEDGKNYTIPRPRPAEADSFFIIRKDWLDALKLKVPTTIDELYQVMKAFTEQDPDKNGKNDTIGFASSVSPTDMGQLGKIESSFTGVNGKWKYVNGEMMYADFLPEERDVLVFLHKLFQEKLIPEDFPSLKEQQVSDLFKSGKAGIFVNKAGTMEEYHRDLSKITPTFKVTDFFPLTSINNYNPKGPGYAGVLAIPKKVPEAKMKQILQLINTWMNEDVFSFQRYGIEGVHYTVKDGEKIVDRDKLTKDNASDFNQIVYVSDPYASSTKEYFPQEANDLYKQIQDERTKNSVADISTGLYSPTAQQYLPEFQKKTQDLKTKILLGVAPITAWDDYINNLKKDANMIKMGQEMTAAYKKRIGE